VEAPMTLTRDFFLWCTLINYGILLLWFMAFVFAREPIQSLHGRWFRLSAEQFDALHYGAMAVYKIGILLFNLVPWVVLSLTA
jgi:hypothetical protein